MRNLLLAHVCDWELRSEHRMKWLLVVKNELLISWISNSFQSKYVYEKIQKEERPLPNNNNKNSNNNNKKIRSGQWRWCHMSISKCWPSDLAMGCRGSPEQLWDSHAGKMQTDTSFSVHYSFSLYWDLQKFPHLVILRLRDVVSNFHSSFTVRGVKSGWTELMKPVNVWKPRFSRNLPHKS